MKQLIPALFAVGAVMLLAGAAVYITGWPLSPYIYTIGATMVALAQINSPSKCKSPTVKRLRRQQIFGALLLVLTGAFMLFTRGNEWIVSLTIAAILALHFGTYSTRGGERRFKLNPEHIFCINKRG